MADSNGYQSTANSSVPRDQQTASSSRRGLTVGRFVNILTLALHFFSFISTICIIGAVGKILNDFQTAGVEKLKGPPTKNHCPFFGYLDFKCNGSQTMWFLVPGDDGACVWYMIGGATLGVSAIVFGIVSIVRIIFAMDVGLVGVLVELVATGILLIPLSIGLAVSITTGLETTCLGYLFMDQCSPYNYQSVSCEDSVGCIIVGDSTTGPIVCWYEAAQVAQGAGWVVALIMLVSMVISVVKLIVWRVRRSHVRRLRAQLGYDKLVQENSEHSPFKE